MLTPENSAYEPPPVKMKPLVFDYAKTTREELAKLPPEELWKREQDLFKREKEIVTREEELFSQWTKGGRKPNWPSFYPILHHNIVADVHTYHKQYTVMLAYYTWFGVPFILLFNVACLLSTMAVEGKDYLPDFLLSVSYLLIGPLLTLIFYRIYYKAARKYRMSLFVTWYLLEGHEFLLLLLFMVGLRGSGAAGVLTAYRNFDSNHNGIGTICVLQVFLWGARALCIMGVGGLSCGFCREQVFYLEPEGDAEAAVRLPPRHNTHNIPTPAFSDVDVREEEEESHDVTASNDGWTSRLGARLPSLSPWKLFGSAQQPEEQ